MASAHPYLRTGLACIIVLAPSRLPLDVLIVLVAAAAQLHLAPLDLTSPILHANCRRPTSASFSFARVVSMTEKPTPPRLFEAWEMSARIKCVGPKLFTLPPPVAPAPRELQSFCFHSVARFVSPAQPKAQSQFQFHVQRARVQPIHGTNFAVEIMGLAFG
ncbi:hypothetical protein CKAH01_08123 [Colletotrichum kahawae]|uniref:Uncharacterized protein n=1 Tax=Colletotrichum kahawae TaxID=34407 RepID=A0AAD9Y513_COLKA|nr:hypothetical protein CKAH01_08123 [Colletotrichum kahawae]